MFLGKIGWLTWCFVCYEVVDSVPVHSLRQIEHLPDEFPEEKRSVQEGDTFSPRDLLPVTERLYAKSRDEGGVGIVSGSKRPEEMADNIFSAYFHTTKRIVILKDYDISGIDALQALALEGEVTTNLQNSVEGKIKLKQYGSEYSESRVDYDVGMNVKGPKKCFLKIIYKPKRTKQSRFLQERTSSDSKPAKSDGSRFKKLRPKPAKTRIYRTENNKTRKHNCKWRYDCKDPANLDTCRLHTSCAIVPNKKKLYVPHKEDEHQVSIQRFRKMLGITLLDEAVEKIIEAHTLYMEKFESKSGAGASHVEDLDEYFNSIILQHNAGMTTPIPRKTTPKDRSDEDQRISGESSELIRTTKVDEFYLKKEDQPGKKRPKLPWETLPPCSSEEKKPTKKPTSRKPRTTLSSSSEEWKPTNIPTRKPRTTLSSSSGEWNPTNIPTRKPRTTLSSSSGEWKPTNIPTRKPRTTLSSSSEEWKPTKRTTRKPRTTLSSSSGEWKPPKRTTRKPHDSYSSSMERLPTCSSEREPSSPSSDEKKPTKKPRTTKKPTKKPRTTTKPTKKPRTKKPRTPITSSSASMETLPPCTLESESEEVIPTIPTGITQHICSSEEEQSHKRYRRQLPENQKPRRHLPECLKPRRQLPKNPQHSQQPTYQLQLLQRSQQPKNQLQLLQR